MDTPTVATAPAPAASTTDAYVAALDAASEAMGVAIRSCLEGDSTWRFAEVQRLCKIGQAIMRMRARANPSVGAYVEPNGPRPNGMLANCNIGGIDPFGAQDDLGLDGDPAYMNGFPRPYGIINGPAAPLNPALPMPRPPVGPIDGAMEMLRETLTTIASNDNKRSQLDILDELRNIGKLLEAKLPPSEREVLQARRDEIIATIRAQTESDRRARESKYGVQTPAAAPHLRCDGCGTAHDGDWVTRNGRPRACDVCGGQMRWSDQDAPHRALPPALDSETTSDPQPEPKENETPCPPSSPRTSGTSRRRTGTSASKRSATARRS